MLKDEPEDLTHLAPTAGDACIPLEEAGLFSPDMFDVMFDSYTSLLRDDIHTLDDADVDDVDVEQKCIVPSISNSSLISNNNNKGSSTGHHSVNRNNGCHIDNSQSPSSSNCSSSNSSCSTSSSLSDPFINYRDESNETIHSPHLLSPSGLEKVSLFFPLLTSLSNIVATCLQKAGYNDS